jgi:serine phosphatase RsbU (regulator of sigma subunit)
MLQTPAQFRAFEVAKPRQTVSPSTGTHPLHVLAWNLVLAIGVALLAWAMFGRWTSADFNRTIVATASYILPAAALSAISLPYIRRWLCVAQFPWDWVIFSGVILAIACTGTAASTAIMLLGGFTSNPSNPWPELYLFNRLAIAMNLLFAAFFKIYHSTRDRLETRNFDLAQRLATETDDVERAREIQKTLMPKDLPRISRCDLAARWQPARAVGGDYFDAIKLDEDRVAVAIGDVVGKGIPAALLMSNLQAIVRSFAQAAITPGKLCEKANEVIAANIGPGKFITFFYAVIDTASMKLDYCCAGHNPPLLLRHDGEIERLGDGGTVLGLFPEVRLPDQSVRLHAGDRLLLFTDGVTEAMNAAGEQFGEIRLIEIINRNRANSANNVLNQILSNVSDHAAGKFQDDVTLLMAVLD